MGSCGYIGEEVRCKSADVHVWMDRCRYKDVDVQIQLYRCRCNYMCVDVE